MGRGVDRFGSVSSFPDGQLELIENKEFSAAATSYDFTTVNGDIDEQYYIVYRLVKGTTGAQSTYLRPNALTTNQRNRSRYVGSTEGTLNDTTGGILLSNNGGNANDIDTGAIWIHAKSGVIRTAEHSWTQASSGGDCFRVMNGWMWNDTSTNITSWRLISTVSNMIGIGSSVRIYRLRKTAPPALVADKLDKTFFSLNNILPTSTYKEELWTMPVPDFSNLNGGTLSRVMSRIRYTAVTNNVHNFGWDLGGLKNKILFIMCGIRSRVYGTQLFLSATAPGVGEIPNGYLVNVDTNTVPGTFGLLKVTAGVFAGIGTTETLWGPPNDTTGVANDVALYYDDSTGELKCFVRQGNMAWSPMVIATDSSFTTMRYVGVRIQCQSTHVTWFHCPMAIYYE